MLAGTGTGTGTAVGGQRQRDVGRDRDGCGRPAGQGAQETAARVGRGGPVRRVVVVHHGQRVRAREPVRRRGGALVGRLLRAAGAGGRRPGRAAGGRLLRRVRPVRGQRAAADGQAVGDHRQAAGERGAVPGPDGHADGGHEDRDAAVGRCRRRRPEDKRRRGQARGLGAAGRRRQDARVLADTVGRADGDVLRRASAAVAPLGSEALPPPPVNLRGF